MVAGPSSYGEPSPAQGTTKVDGWEFTSAFDSGNALVTSWKREHKQDKTSVWGEKPDDIPTFSVDIAADCYGEIVKGRKRVYWFYFGVTPPEPQYRGAIRLAVHGMSSGNTAVYKPWVSTPSSPRWERIAEEAAGGKSYHDGWQLVWTHQFDGKPGMTRFAFCHPYEYSELLAWLDRLELAFQQEDRVGASENELIEFLKDYNLDPRDGFFELTTPDPNRSVHHDPEEFPESGFCHDFDNGYRIAADVGYYEKCSEQYDSPVQWRAGEHVYFHRETLARSPMGRIVDILTITDERWESTMEFEEFPKAVQDALGDAKQKPARRFRNRPICFFSGRVHPGETPGQFAVNGTLQFIVSDDPRAAELRRRFVFKVVPMLNPDGVACGHSRTNSHGHDLNRCYRRPTPDHHEGVYAVKHLLMGWAARGDLLFYMDCHGHGARRGCFLFGNHQGNHTWSSEDATLWNVAYVHAAQLNSPHLDIDACEWSRHGHTDKDKDDEMDETSRSDSGRAQIGESCRLYHAYTLECNYHISRAVRPVPEAPGLSVEAQSTQSLRGEVCDEDRNRPGWGKRPKPVPYNASDWASVGEALAVALLDMHGLNVHSRLINARPPKPLVKPEPDLTETNKRLEQLFDELAAQHAMYAKGNRTVEQDREQTTESTALSADVHPVQRRLYTVVHQPLVYIRSKPSTAGKALGGRKPGDKVMILEVLGSGWAKLDPAEILPRKGIDGYMLLDGSSIGLGELLRDSYGCVRVPQEICPETGVRARCAPLVEDVQKGLYPPT